MLNREFDVDGRVLRMDVTGELRHVAMALIENGREMMARTMVKKLYSVGERRTSNCRGLANKRRLDMVRLNAIKNCVFSLLPCAATDRDKLWSACIRSIDSMNRDLARRAH